mgnify:CR=1 FL=1|jgi:hypothetical protein
MNEMEKMAIFSWALAFAVIAYILVKKQIEK